MSSATKEEEEVKKPSSVKRRNTTGGAVSSDSHKRSGGGGGGLFDYLRVSRKKIIHNNVGNTTSPSSAAASADNANPKIMQRKSGGGGGGERMKYHRLANAAGSQYFGSIDLPDSDSDNDDTNNNNNNAATKFAVASASSSASAPSSSSWLAKFQTQEKHRQPLQKNMDELKTDNTTTTMVQQSSSPSPSWMNKAWQKTVDSATDWMPSSPSKLPNSNSDNSSSAQPSSSWWTVLPTSTFSNAISSINNITLPSNPFKDDSNESIVNNDVNNVSINNSNSASNNKSAHLLLPKIASRFNWATKRLITNPYQAVIGRSDTDYYLLSGGSPLLFTPSHYFFGGGARSNSGGGVSSFWGLISLQWLPWWLLSGNGGGGGGRYNNVGGRKVLGDGSDGENGGTKATTTTMNEKSSMVMRRKSLPSAASVLAVKNLLALVGQQHDDDLLFQQKQQQKGPPSPQPVHRSPSVDSFTPRSPSIQPFPDLQQDSSSYELSDHSPMNHYPSPRMTPVRSFLASPKHHNPSGSAVGSGVQPPPPPLTLPKSSSSPVIRHHSSSLQDSSIHSTNTTSGNKNNPNGNNNQAADAEMAARLAEGTLRAYRDLALDEATELHSALHHWTLRWERPFLGWLEAGPTVWFSDKGYSPYSAGKKVSQIQAVLARRCAVIGEIQQHLWRANWQRGVAEWGMLGHGQGEWTAVMLEHGDMTDAAATTPGPSPQKQKGKKKSKRISMKIFNHSSFVGGNVSNSRGGSILVDEDELATWSIDGIKVVRDQLYRAAVPGAQLPCYDNWPNEVRHFNGDTVGHSDEIDHPAWASTKGTKATDKSPLPIVINNLPGMADEVSALLQSIELNLDQQRQRRLNKLRPPSNLRRNWYMIALGIPTAAYATYHVCKDHGGYFLLKEFLAKIGQFYNEHVSEPCRSIYQELFTKTGRIDVNDRKARIDTIESLKRMIRSWLDETFADMPEAEKVAMSNNMDISLIEELKEVSIKHIYEINSVVRCSLIEMQFIKKELLNALVAMDELMGSNEINARLAAMTPAVILIVAIRKAFRVIFYALFKFGASKQEIYASFRKTILDIERLLLMRDDPPPRPESLSWGSTQHTRSGSVEADDIENNLQSRQTLSAADLG